jgi:hypothetical protein
MNNNDIKKIGSENNKIYDDFLQIKNKFKLVDKNIYNLNNLEKNNKTNEIEIQLIKEKIDKLEKDLLLNKNETDEVNELQTENLTSLENFNSKVINENESRENLYQEMIKESQNNNLMIENKIKSL